MNSVKTNLKNGLVLIIILNCAAVTLAAPGNAGRAGSLYEPMGMQNNPGGQAAQGIQNIINNLFNDYVTQATPLLPDDIEIIRGEMKKITASQGQLDKTYKAYLSMIEAYLAFYSGQPEEAMDKIRKAAQMDEENSDITDSLIVIGLCTENYNLVKPLLKKRNAGEDVTLPPLTDAVGAAQPYTDPKSGSGKSSKWTVETPETNAKEGGAPGAPMMPGLPAAGGRGAGRPGQQGMLNLPVKCMPADNLGESFSDLNMRVLNGTYFHYEVGKGQILTAFLWTLPYKAEGQNTPGYGDNAAISIYTPAPSYGSSDSSAKKSNIPPVAFDLATNLEQYRQLMLQNAMHGRMFFLTSNLDAGNQNTMSKILTTFSKEPWPWANCMVNDSVNFIQWPVKQRYSPVMMIVDTAGKIRYIGPVGGFLPRMIIAQELLKATPATILTDPTQFKLPTVPTTTAAPESKTDVQTEPTSPTPGDSADTPKGKPSEPQAKSMLQAVYLKKKVSPVGALQQCDEIIERFPDSLEADEAKVIIKGILSSRPELTQQRKEKGKYTGE